ncbi:hypothetical protein ACFWUP_12885 [Nocardia sp. NPDC058658]|uniref:hypothetical protein n=1 Tax=Nocardia sp. NPDC058658 TaxID=3346580 RepID=UPI00365BCAFE
MKSKTILATAGLAALVLSIGAAPGVSLADTGSGDTGSGDTGSAVIDTGSGVLDTGSGILGDLFGSGSAATQQCNNSTKSGGEGVTTTIHQLGTAGPTAFNLVYETYDVPDRIQVFYQGAQIHDTGYVGDQINQGTGSAVVTVPAGGATSVTVRVTGPSGTKWDYTVRCP